MLSTAQRPQKYRYKSTRQVDQEEELNKLLSFNQPIEFEDEEEEISELHEFHDNVFPANEKDVDYEFDRIVNKERSELLFREEDERGLEDLQEFEHEEELYGHLVEPNLDTLDGALLAHEPAAQKGLTNES
jgi:hypothetical protein